MTPRAALRSDLSRTAIVDRALAVADAEGPAAVSIRRLAQEFGVTPMALYWHVENKDELLAAMGDRFYDDLPEVSAELPWHEQLRGLSLGVVESLSRHPASAELAAHRVAACENGQLLTERVLGLLRDAGFGVREAADIAGQLLHTCIALVTGMAGAEPEVARAERETVLESKRALLRSLPPERFPNLVASAEALTSCDDPDRYFGFGLDLFLAGVQRLSER